MGNNFNQNKRGTSYQSNSRGRKEDSKLPEGYLKEGYYEEIDGKKALRKEYIIIYPRKIAEELSKEGKQKNTRSQIRKYYEYSLRVCDQLKHQKNQFELVEADFKRLEPFAEYAKSRKRVSALFVDFIRKNVAAVKNADDLRAFIKHFEAIVAYLKND